MSRMLTWVIPPDSGTTTILAYDIRSNPVMAKQGFGVVKERHFAGIILCFTGIIFIRFRRSVTPVYSLIAVL
jgi:ABC-type Na+ transport system ATPase subunit NatA